MQVQIFRAFPPKNIWGPNTRKISVDFIFIQPQTLIANRPISGTSQDIKNRKDDLERFLPRSIKGPVNFGQLITENNVTGGS